MAHALGFPEFVVRKNARFEFGGQVDSQSRWRVPTAKSKYLIEIPQNQNTSTKPMKF